MKFMRLFFKIAICLTCSLVAAQDWPVFELNAELINSGQPIALNGDWYFQYGVHAPIERIQQQRLSADFETIPVPDRWNAHVEDKTSNPYQHGLATYAAELRFDAQVTAPLSLFVPLLRDGYRILFIEQKNQHLHHIGEQGDWQSGTHTSLKYRQFNLPAADGLLVIYVAKQLHFKGGIEEAIQIQLTDELIDAEKRNLIFRSVIAGGLFVMFVHYFVQFIYWPKSSSLLWIALVCLVMFFRTLVTTGMSDLFLQTWLPIYSMVRARIDFLTIFLSPVVLLFFFQSMIPMLPTWMLTVCRTSSILFGCLTAILPVAFLHKNLNLYQLIALFWTAVLMANLIRSAWRNDEYARPILMGCLVLFLGFSNDLYAAQSRLYNLLVSDFTLILFLYIQANIVGKKLNSNMEQFALVEREKSWLEHDHKRVIEASQSDFLTGLYNRQALDHYYDSFIQKAKETNRPIGIILFDLDSFKAINDTYGHDVGDQVLSGIAALLRNDRKRETDFYCRFGGEEFLILLPGADIFGAATLAEYYRELFEESVVYQQEQVSITVTGSFGVSYWHPHMSHGLKEQWVVADEALYEAKDKGRNCIVMRPRQ